jgi:conjugative transfer signal peptidase TraF
MNAELKPWLAQAYWSLLIPGLLAGWWILSGVRLNYSVSLPEGLYVRTPGLKSIWRGDMIEFCTPGEMGPLAVARGYIPSGPCPDGGIPLLKPVIAIESDRVDVTAEGIVVNGRLIPGTEPLTNDSQRRHLPRYWGHAKGLWVASTYDPRSFDSRYYGPVPAPSVRLRLRPLWTWDRPRTPTSRHIVGSHP